tara:strand:- start:20302 stop:21669 length:1368 start_codon:yes stop_codon:yes gene_type:complete
MQIPLSTSTAEQNIAGDELLVNVFPRNNTGSKYPFSLIGTPGLAFFLELPTFPVIGLHRMGAKAFAFTKSHLYEIFNDGSFKERGEVDLTDRVVIADNGIDLVVVDGFKGFKYNIDAHVTERIVDDAFYPSTHVVFQDGYFIFNRKDSGQFFLSKILSTDFDPLDYATAEGQPDNLVGVLSDHRELFLFGTESIEVWYNSGSSDFPFERNQAAFVEKGCAAPYSLAKQNNTVYFVGSDLMVYQMAGYTPIRISNHAVEKTLKNVNIDDAFAYTYQEDGHLFYVLTIPVRDLTWCYDITTGGWHIRKSYHFGRHISNNAILFNAKTLVGDFQNGRIYQMVSNYHTDDGAPIVREFVLPTVSRGREFLTIDSLEFDMSSGVGLTSGQGDNPELRVYFSKDSGNTYSQSFKRGYIGKKGEYLTRAKVNRFGASRQFTFKVEISDPIPIDIGGAWVEVR